MPQPRTGPLRKAQDVSLARTPAVRVELHDPAASLLAVHQDAAGTGLALAADDRELLIDVSAVPAGTSRIVIAVQNAARAGGARCVVRDDRGDDRGADRGADLAAVSMPASPDPLHLLGECYRRRGEWRFREIGYGLADEAAITRELGPDAAAHHRQAARHRAAVQHRPAAHHDQAVRPVRGLPPPNLEAARIGGARSVDGPVGLEVAVDLSGSMQGYTRLRLEALHALAGFARREMAAGDLLTSVAFADRAAVLVPPVDVRRLRHITDRPSRDVGGGTLLSPAVKLLIDLRPPGTAVQDRALMVITDVGLGDDPRTLGALLTRAAYRTVHLVVPRGMGSATTWVPLREATVHPFVTADQLGLVYGAVYADLTGQRLERR